MARMRVPQESTALTKVAGRAVLLAHMFGKVAAKVPVGAYKVEMTVPGSSTAGGALALQHIRLIPPEGDQILVVGNANLATQTGELRTLENVDAISRQRWHRRSGLDPVAYAAFFAAAQAFLEEAGLTVTVTGVPAAEVVKESAPSRRVVGIAAASASVVVVAVGVVGYVLLARAPAEDPPSVAHDPPATPASAAPVPSTAPAVPSAPPPRAAAAPPPKDDAVPAPPSTGIAPTEAPPRR